MIRRDARILALLLGLALLFLAGCSDADPEVPAALPPPVSISGNATSKRLTSVAVVGTSGWS